MKRTEKTIQEYKQQLIDKGIDNISEFVEMVISADITKGKYTRFLLDCFIANKFRVEDLQGGLESSIGQAISLFHKHKAKLSEEMRSVTKYSSPGDLWNAVKQYEQVLTGKEEKQAEKEKAYSETEFIYHDEDTGFQIISPKTVYSAQWWGRGTRWCTSAENNNQFEEYIKYAPLFIILMPASANTARNRDKLQLWKYDDNIQFMDEADNYIELDYIEENWDYLKDICLWLKDLIFIPEGYRTRELCELAVEQNGRNLGCVPVTYRTPELCKLAVKQNGWALEYVPEELKTHELCKLAVEKTGSALYHVPKRYETEEIYKIAVEQDADAFKLIPEKYRTPELFKDAVQKNGLNLFYVPEQHKTPELCKLAVTQNGFALYYLPKKYKTPEICKLAVEQKGMALEYVPEELKTPEICQIAVGQNVMALQFVPEELKVHLENWIIIQKSISIPVSKFIIPDYTEQYNEIRLLFKENNVYYEP